MKSVTIRIALLLAALGALASCAGTIEGSILSEGTQDGANERIVWVGTGVTFRYKGGEWVRTPSQDYDFLVRQFRYETHWESLKIQNRTHEEYDGSAGPADQQHFFFIEYDLGSTGDNYGITLRSSYGAGEGISSKDFTRAVLELDAEGVHRLAPYNRFRITQEYDYDEGRLFEIVELFDLNEDGNELPFVRIEERAVMYFPLNWDV